MRSAHYEVAGEDLWRRACEGFRTDEVQIAAGAAAEFATCGDFARTSRGTWGIEYQRADNGEVRITLTNTLTLRKFTFLTHTTLGADTGLYVDISDNTMWRRVDLERLGADVVARAAVARLRGARSSDVEGTLGLLASDLLRRDATRDDEVTLLALAATQRYVTPVGEAAIRRALWAIAARDHGHVEREALVLLAEAVGVSDTFNLSGAGEGTH